MADAAGGPELITLAGVTLDTTGVERGVQRSLQALAVLAKANAESAAKLLEQSKASKEAAEAANTFSRRTADLGGNLDRAAKQSEEMGRGVKKIADGAKESAQGLEKLTEAVKAAAKYFLIYEVVGRLSTAFSDMIEETAEGQQKMARLEAQLKATGFAAGLTAKQIGQLNREMVQSSLFSDDDVNDAIARLMVFRSVQGDVFREAIKLSADLAAVNGGGMSRWAQTLGRSLEDPKEGLTALSRAGVIFTTGEEKMIASLVEANRMAEAQAMILDKLEGSVGGAAAAMDTGLSRALHEANQEWSDFLERLGNTPAVSNVVVPALSEIAFILHRLFPDEEEELYSRMSKFFESMQEYEEIMRKAGATEQQIERFRNAAAINAPALGNLPGLNEEQTRNYRRTVQEYKKLVDEKDEIVKRDLEQQKEAEEAAKKAAAAARKRAEEEAAAARAEAARKAKAEEAKARQQSIRQMLDSLKQERDTLGMTSVELAEYRLRAIGASEAEVKQGVEIAKTTQARRDSMAAIAAHNQKVEAARKATVEYIASLEKQVDAMRRGMVASLGHTKALEGATPAERRQIKTLESYLEWMERRKAAREEAQKAEAAAAEQYQRVWVDAVDRTADSFGQFFTDLLTGKIEDFRDFTRQMLDLWVSMIAQMEMAQLASKAASWIGSLVGGATGSAPDLPDAMPLAPINTGGFGPATPPPAVPAFNVGGVSRSMAAASAPFVVNQTITFPIHAIDGRDVARMLQEQKGTIAKITAEAVNQSYALKRQLQGVGL